MNNLKDYIDNFSFRDEIAKATEFKEEIKEAISTASLNSFDFEEDIQPIEETIIEPIQQPQIVEEYEEPYDAESNATSLVYTLTAIDGLLLSFAVQFKCRSNAGGSRVIKKMKSALSKELSGEELSDYEKTLIAKFKEYKSNIQLLSGEVLPNQGEIDRMIKTAIPYCEETKFKIGKSFSFWTNYSGNLVQRLSKILTA
jgi:hypothetical protein